MGLINALMGAYNFVTSGVDGVTLESWEQEVDETKDVGLYNEWQRVKTTYGAAHVNPNHLSQPMLALFMQCVTERTEEFGKSYEVSRTKTITQSERARMERYNDGR